MRYIIYSGNGPGQWSRSGARPKGPNGRVPPEGPNVPGPGPGPGGPMVPVQPGGPMVPVWGPARGAQWSRPGVGPNGPGGAALQIRKTNVCLA